MDDSLKDSLLTFDEVSMVKDGSVSHIDSGFVKAEWGFTIIGIFCWWNEWGVSWIEQQGKAIKIVCFFLKKKNEPEKFAVIFFFIYSGFRDF